MNVKSKGQLNIKPYAILLAGYVMGKLFGGDLKERVAKLERQSTLKIATIVSTIFVLLFGTALYAASFGAIGLGVYFLAALILFY